MGGVLSPALEGQEFSDKEFSFLCKLVYDETGIVLGERKQEMVHRRIMRRLRELKLNSFKVYIKLLQDENSTELPNFINAITTNLTSFFRENHHFDYLKNEFLPEHFRQFSNSKRLRVWSAGCSTGEEPYSLAITLLETKGVNFSGWDAKILATDLDSEVINTGLQGIYKADRIEKINPEIKSKYFLKNRTESGETVRVKQELREYITFKQFNFLSSTWPMKGPFDIIFCRNVLIYFDKETQAHLVNKFCSLLRPGGCLMLGHSESVGKQVQGLDMIGRTIFRRDRRVSSK